MKVKHLIPAANNSRLLCVRCLLSRWSSDRMWEKVKIFIRETIKSAIELSWIFPDFALAGWNFKETLIFHLSKRNSILDECRNITDMHLLLQVMSAIINSIFTTILAVEFIIGNLLNGFIALVNCLDWVQKRQISLVDKIVTALTVFRVAQLWLVKIIVLIFLIYSVKVTETMLRVTNTAWVVTNHFNLWLSTKLSVFYLLKIVNFSNSFFLYLKWRVRQVFSMSPMLSLVFLFLNIKVINTHIDVWIDVNGRNMPYNFSFMNSNSTSLLKHILSTNSIFAVIPFVMSLVAFFPANTLFVETWEEDASHCQ